MFSGCAISEKTPFQPLARLQVVFLLFAILASYLSSCSVTAPPPLPPSPLPSESPASPTPLFPAPSPLPSSSSASPIPLSPSPLPSEFPASSTPLPPAFPHYDLQVELDYTRHHVSVEEKITYTNPASEALSDLLLAVEPLYYPGVFTLTRLAWGDGQAIPGAETDGAQIRIPLAQPLEPGASLQISIAYELALPSPEPSANTRPVPFGYTARQTNLVDWYPFIPPYLPGQGWLLHPAGYYGEHLAYPSASFDVRLRLVDGRPDLLVAASAAEQVEGDWRRYHLEAARSFALSVSHQYQVFSAPVGEVTVLSYAFSIHETAGREVLQTTAEALNLYQQLFGPYPHDTLTVVEADFLDGMEYDGLYFLSNGFYNLYQGEPGDYLVAIAAHETAHQWWFGLVGNDQGLEPWLDEALSTYSERLYYEHLHPEALEWWWNYRVRFYEPRGWVDDSIYNPHGEVQAFRTYRDAVYLNGALFLEDLRTQIGDPAFFAFLQDYVRQYSHRIATSQDFFSLLREHTQVDLTPLISKYFAKTY